MACKCVHARGMNNCCSLCLQMAAGAKTFGQIHLICFEWPFINTPEASPCSYHCSERPAKDHLSILAYIYSRYCLFSMTCQSCTSQKLLACQCTPHSVGIPMALGKLLARKLACRFFGPSWHPKHGPNPIPIACQLMPIGVSRWHAKPQI